MGEKGRSRGGTSREESNSHPSEARDEVADLQRVSARRSDRLLNLPLFQSFAKEKGPQGQLPIKGDSNGGGRSADPVRTVPVASRGENGGRDEGGTPGTTQDQRASNAKSQLGPFGESPAEHAKPRTSAPGSQEQVPEGGTRAESERKTSDPRLPSPEATAKGSHHSLGSQEGDHPRAHPESPTQLINNAVNKIREKGFMKDRQKKKVAEAMGVVNKPEQPKGLKDFLGGFLGSKRA